MCLLFESIRIKNNNISHLPYHQRRVEQTYLDLFKSKCPFKLSDIITIPEKMKSSLVKCKVIYGKDSYSINYDIYKPREIKSLKIINTDNISYNYKYFDRRSLEELYKQRDNCDEIIIVKDGFITDTSFSNLIFWDGENWFTPTTYLLNGTCRQRLIFEKEIFEKEISLKNYKSFKSIKLINAMLLPTESNSIPISRIM